MYCKITQDAIASFSDLTVLVVGDFMLDCFVYGTLDRISPEAPIPILLGRDQETMLGGGGNVVANIVSLGGTAIPCTVIGRDDAGAEVRRMISQFGSNSDGILQSDSRRTSRKSRFIAQNQQVLRFDEEDHTSLNAADRNRLFEYLETALEQTDIVILSDYGKGVLSDAAAAEIITQCSKRNIPVLVDPKGPDYAIYAGATAVTPNRAELSLASGSPVGTDTEVEHAARGLVERHGFEFVLATRSEEGMSVVGSSDAHHIATVAQDVFDVSGAGDTVIASFALSLAAGLDQRRAASVANAAAGAAVAKRGTAQVTRDELAERMIGALEMPDNVDRDTAGRLVRNWKNQGLTVGFTNGCFDILHAGHISLFRQARRHCDRLVVGLNTDNSVSGLKGPGRPVNKEQDRAAVLSALAAVDAVVLFDEDTPLELISALLPDVLVKGADYNIDEVVGADVVQADGGTVLLAELTPDKSTSSTISHINALENKN